MHVLVTCSVNSREKRHELGRIYWNGLLYRMADTRLHLLFTKLVGLSIGGGNHVPHRYLARFLSLGPLTMDEDTKLVLDAWRGLLVENAQLHRRVNALEKELGYTYVAQRLDDGWNDVSWRRVGRGRRRDADSCD